MKFLIKKRLLRVVSLFTAISAAVVTAAGCSDTGEGGAGSLFGSYYPFEASFTEPEKTVSGNAESSAEQQSFTEPSFTESSRSDAPENSFTLMVYMCGSDLEENMGSATKDIFEMIAGCGDNKNVNVIAQTGGSTKWLNNVVASDRCQRYKFSRDGMILTDDTVGQKCMGTGDTLRDFIGYTTKNYPAERYGLILWDHGGGAISGWCYDKNYPVALMSMSELSAALSSAGTYFDFICFDACLMGGFETCIALEPYTDRLIASEEVIPNCGLYYTDFISSLYSDPSIPVDDLSRVMIDSYVEHAYEESPFRYSTLGVFDTKKAVNSLLPALNSTAQNCFSQLNGGGFSELSLMRSRLREMSEGENYVDMYSFAEALNDRALIRELDNTTVYFKATPNASDDHGLNIYYPYHDLSLIDSMDTLYGRAGISTGYTNYLHGFANVMAGGQKTSDTKSSGVSPYTEYEWYDDSEAYSSDYYEEYNSSSDIDKLEIIKRDGQFVLDLSDEDREIISSIRLVCMVPFENGFIDLGTDDSYELDDQDDLIIGYDKTWVALDGEIVPFYTEETYEENGGFVSYGYVPCEYNGVKSQLLLVWSSELPQGFVAGVRPVYDDSAIANKGVFDLNDGDKFRVTFDVYDENMNYLQTVTDDREYTVDGDITVSYEDVSGLGDTFIFYSILDIFNNVYTTESVTYPA